MPQAIPIIAAALAYAYPAYAAVIAVVALAASAVVSSYQARKAKRSAIAAYNESLEDRLQMTATASASRSFIYGRARNVDGILFKGTHGPDSRFYTLVIAIAGHKINGFEKLYFNDIPVDLLSDGVPISGPVGGVGYWVNTSPFAGSRLESLTASMVVSGGSGSVVLPHTPAPGSVTAVIQVPSEGTEQFASPLVVGNTVSVSGALVDGTWTVNYQYNQPLYKARVWMYDGSPGQTLYPLLSTRFPSLLTPSDKFGNIALVVAELEYDLNAYPTGVPSISAVVRGAEIEDTRTGLTAWSENPAMIARAWLLNPKGGGMLTSDINEASFIAAANACDTSTVFNLAGGGTETRPLYQCGIVCPTEANPDDYFGEMVEAMAGKSGFSGGQIKVTAGVYRAPVLAINDTFRNDTEPVIVVKDPQKADIVNHFRPVIANAEGWVNGATGPTTATAFTATQMPSVRSPAFIAADGQELIRETTMLGVTRNVHAQHICGVMMRDMRDGMMVTLTCNMRAWAIELFDIVTLTLPVFGFNAKQFEVVGRKYEVEKGVTLSLKETAASIYSVSSGLGVLDAAVNTELPKPWVVSAIAITSITSGTVELEDGTFQTRMKVEWGLSPDASVKQSGRIEVQYIRALAPSMDDAYWTSVYAAGGEVSTTIVGLQQGGGYIVRIRAVNSIGVQSAWSVQGTHGVAVPDVLLPSGSVSVPVKLAVTQVLWSSGPSNGFFGVNVAGPALPIDGQATTALNATVTGTVEFKLNSSLDTRVEMVVAIIAQNLTTFVYSSPLGVVTFPAVSYQNSTTTNKVEVSLTGKALGFSAANYRLYASFSMRLSDPANTASTRLTDASFIGDISGEAMKA